MKCSNLACCRKEKAWCRNVKDVWFASSIGATCQHSSWSATLYLRWPGLPTSLLQKPYEHPSLTIDEADFNFNISSVRVAVEWIFRDIIDYYKFLDFKKNLNIGLSPVGKMYTVAALLRNAVTCLYGSSTGSYFQIQPLLCMNILKVINVILIIMCSISIKY